MEQQKIISSNNMLCPVYSIGDLKWLGGRDNFETKDKKYKIKNWGKGYEKGFGFIKTSPDQFEVTNYDDYQIERCAIFKTETLQECIDWLNTRAIV